MMPYEESLLCDRMNAGPKKIARAASKQHNAKKEKGYQE